MESTKQFEVEGRLGSKWRVDPNPCPICLGPVNIDAYLDHCFHRYCYNCILRWAKVANSKKSSRQAVSVKCPLCKVDNFSIIHGYTESASAPHENTFQRHYINQDAGHSTFFTEEHKYRWACYSLEPGSLSDAFKVTRYWKSGKYLQPNRWLHSWLQREMQALLQEKDVDIVVHHIHGVIESFCRSDKRRSRREAPDFEREKFKSMVLDAAGPFLGARTGRFMMEVELFLASGLIIEAYDKAYKKLLGWKDPVEEEDEDGNSEGVQRSGNNSCGCERQRAGSPCSSYTYLFNDFSDQEAD